MPAYLVVIYEERCVKCGMKATHKLYNTHNALVAHFCKHHADRGLADFKAKHEGIKPL